MHRSISAVSFFAIFAALAPADSLNRYIQTNLVSDLPGEAAHQDADLVNPWGIVAGPSTPFWIADNHTGLSTLYNGAGTKLPLVVTVPPAAGNTGPGAPTGLVFNGSSGFGGARFIYDSEDGTLSAWSSGTSATLQATSPTGSVYKGLAIGSGATGQMLYAANFGLGKVDVFDSTFKPISVAGGFTDSTIPAGFAPFGIQNINGDIYVTYARQDAAKEDDIPGPGSGFINVFDTNGNLIRRLASDGALNSPWGLTLAPSQFGAFGGDLLVGNFGDGAINAYNPATGAFLGSLAGSNGSALAIQGLWGLSFGNGAQGQDPNTLYFTAGIPGDGAVEDHGLFGAVAVATPEPQSAMLLGVAGLFLSLLAFRGRAKSILLERSSKA